MFLLKYGISALLFLPLTAVAQPPATPRQPFLQPGVSEALAAYRSKTISQLQYALQFTLPAGMEVPVEGSEQLSFTLSANTRALQVDFRGKPEQLKQVTVNGRPVPVVLAADHLLLQPAFLRKGKNQVSISFTAGNPALNRHPEFLYTLLVPDRARTVFPCFDQPDLKASFRLSLLLPRSWRAISNAPVKDSAVQGEVKTYHFLPSDPISTYLFSFTAGHFSELTRNENGRTMQLLYRETDSSKLAQSLLPIFSIQANALQFLEAYTQIPYPFRKFDCAALPDFQFGGMEHPGAIQYKAATLFLEKDATRDQLIARSNLLSHETAHMWFGDLVTMRWFNDVWMKEVFANFLADKISNLTLTDNNYDLKFLTDHFPAAYAIDRTPGTHPIRQQLNNLQEAGSLYGNIIYHKAPIMMRQLERLMGDEAFRNGLREYLKHYAYGNATWPNLIDLLDEYTDEDLKAWNKVWVNEAGRPVFDYRLQTSEGKITQLVIRQTSEQGGTHTWPQLFETALVYSDHIEELTVNMQGKEAELVAAKGKPAPLCVLFNSSGQGYGVFPIDTLALPRLATLISPVMRASAYINLYENMLNGHILTPLQLLQFNLRTLRAEQEELCQNLLLDQLNQVFWRLLPPAQRLALAPGIENTLWQQLEQTQTAGQKKLLFKTYSSIALGKTAQDRLYRIWQTRQPPAGLSLYEDDYTSLATALALREYPGYQAVLDSQLQRITNPDRQLRLRYLLPALSADTAVRDQYFASLKMAGNRNRESWVLAALGYLHHPLRGSSSEKYLPATLDLLEEIQRTGDIFFPQGWLQSSFSWYQSTTVATTLRRFLEAHPDYNPKLKAKIVQVADNVFRAERLVR